MENSGYNFSGMNNRYGDLISDPGLSPNAGKPSRPLSKYWCFGSLNGIFIACNRSCSSPYGSRTKKILVRPKCFILYFFFLSKIDC